MVTEQVTQETEKLEVEPVSEETDAVPAVEAEGEAVVESQAVTFKTQDELTSFFLEKSSLLEAL